MKKGRQNEQLKVEMEELKNPCQFSIRVTTLHTQAEWDKWKDKNDIT